MSKKWITFLVAAVIGALLLPTVAMADCRVDVITRLGSGTVATQGIFDATSANFLGDPVPLPVGDKVTKVVPTYGGAVNANVLNAEGLGERVQDLLVTDNAAGAPCFGAVNNSVTFSINALVTNPAPGTGIPSAPANIDVYDSNGIGGLGVVANSSIAIGGGNTQQTNITVQVTHTGTAGDLLVGPAGAAYRIKNIRIDATSVTGGLATWSANIAGNANGFALVLFPNSVNGNSGATTNTLNAAAAGTNAIGVGTQNSGSGLTGIFAQLPNLQENAANTFRTAGAACSTGFASGGTAASYSTAAGADTCSSGVANDIATNATSLVFAVSAIPSGVTVTFPSTMSTSAQAAGGPFLTWTSTTRGGSPLAFTSATGATTDVVVYDTTTNQAGAFGTGINIESADTADAGTPIGTAVGGTTNPNCVVSGGAVVSNNVGAGGNCDAMPKIGVFVGNPSGQGTATIRVAFGRGATSRFTGDDVAPAGTFPVYTGSRRELVSTTAGLKNSFFTITPTRTTLLFPFVTTSGSGFNTGVAVANTCGDANVFTTGSGATRTTNVCTISGGITFFFVGVNAATGAAYSASLATDLSAGGAAIPASACPAANLDANGRLAPGKTFTCGVAGLLSQISGAPASFTGYMMAVLNANFGHGFAVQFGGGGAPYAAAGALVLSSGSGARGGCAAGDCGLGQ